MPWPRIVAESLCGLAEAPSLTRTSIRPSDPAAVAQAIACAATPDQGNGTPPPFLRPHQVVAWRRVVAALDRWQGALLAEPVGRGKTWIALAVAACESGPVVALVPAILTRQWEEAGAQAGIEIRCWTHERASRGALPTLSPSLVIIDEAHRFRDAAARRVRTVAPWLVGRRVLLLTATPIINRIDDLVTLLQLAVPDDALCLDGVRSLTQLREMSLPPSAVRRLVIRTNAPTVNDHVRRAARIIPSAAEESSARRAVTAISSLQLSGHPAVRRLMQSVLLDAAASSAAALRAALSRYRALLLQARDAGGGSRQFLRKFAGDSLDQLVMWELLTHDADQETLPLDDIALVTELLECKESVDDWITPLLERITDSRPTVCFARHRATARALRIAAGDLAAWVLGSTAGIGPHRVPRDTVLAAFGPHRAGWRARVRPPMLLIATDVAAEGLNLQAAGRILHVDLPWTAMRVEQREGRLLRPGQEHPDVEVLVRPPGAEIEAALRLATIVRRKATLSERWLSALQANDLEGPCPAQLPIAFIRSPRAVDRPIVAVHLSDGVRHGVMLLALSAGGEWNVIHHLPEIALSAAVACPGAVIAHAAFGAIGDAATRAAVAMASASSTGLPAAGITHIHALARREARRRNAETLGRLDRLLRFAARAPTLGGRILLDELMAQDDAHWLALKVPDRPPTGPIVGRPVAALLFRSPAAALR